MTIPSDRRVFVRALLPGAFGLVIPAPAAGSGLVRGASIVVPIPYTDLPTGAGSWNTGGGLVTIDKGVAIGTDGAGANLIMNGAANGGGARDLQWATGGVLRWIVRTDTGAETGSNVGSPWELGARADNGSSIDNPIVIVRAAGGLMSLSRPVTVAGLLTAAAGVESTVGSGSIVLGGVSSKLRVQRQASNTMGLYAESNAYAHLNVSSLYAHPIVEFRSGAEATMCGWNATAADTLRWFDHTGENRLEFKYTDGQPLIGLVDDDWQLSLGNLSNSGYILLNGTNNSGAEDGNVLITGNTNGATGDVKIRGYNGSAVTVRANFASGGVTIHDSGGNAPTGGPKGAGTINLAGDIYRNNSVYNNPDYVFETAYEGAPRSPAPEGYRIRPLAEVEQFTKDHLHLPGISREASGMFARADMLLEKVEELYLHTFALGRRVDALEEENRRLRIRAGAWAPVPA